VQKVKEVIQVGEGGTAHFEARLEPTGVPGLKVEWYKDNKLLEASSRITTFFNFGYVALTIKQLTIFDNGVYTCRALNSAGEAITSGKLVCTSKSTVVQDSQCDLEKLQHLEDSSRYQRTEHEETSITTAPRFLGQIKGTQIIKEGQNAHFECRLEPLSDTTLTVEWYFNGKALMVGSRFKTYHDFGYVALDIFSCTREDTGTYTIVARNALGEVQAQTEMTVQAHSSIDTSSMHKLGHEKATRLEQAKFTEPQYDIEDQCKAKPVFTRPLSDPHPVKEGQSVHVECRLEPLGDPTLQLEWFHNGHPLTIGSRIRTYFDFGYVALDLYGVTMQDTGEYTARATNRLGSAHTSAQIKVTGDSNIVTDTIHEEGLQQVCHPMY
jgi:hypothetical protein